MGWFIKKPANAKSLLVDKVLLLSLIENTKMYKTTFLGLLYCFFIFYFMVHCVKRGIKEFSASNQ